MENYYLPFIYFINKIFSRLLMCKQFRKDTTIQLNSNGISTSLSLLQNLLSRKYLKKLMFYKITN